MYKSDIAKALARISLVPGGATEGLLKVVSAIQAQLNSALSEIASNSDATIKAGQAHLHEAIRPLILRLGKISLSGTAIELHQLGAQFDAVFVDHPILEPLLRPGRQAVASLAGAFDVALQHSRDAPSVIGLVPPGLELANCYLNYAALADAFSQSAADDDSVASSQSIEISGAEDLRKFSNYLVLLAHLMDIAKSIVEEDSHEPETLDHEVWIASIESGSPIQINLKGDGRTLRLMLTMLKDIVRAPYLHFTSHGRVLQTMETFARAKELGIKSPELLSRLSEAMLSASQTYAQNLRGSGVAVSIDGEPIREDATQSLNSPVEIEANSSPVKKLSAPKNID